MLTDTTDCLVICMVGLPARGKSYLSRKIARYLNWVGLKSKVFNNGLYRRVSVGTNCDSHFFDQKNKEAQKAREQCALEALDDAINYLLDDNKAGQIAIIDATNSRIQRRRIVEQYIKDHLKKKYTLIWVETICTIPKIIEENILKTKINSPDYIGWDPNKAIQDFRERIKEYEKVYETLSKENDGENNRYIKLINQNATIILQNIRGYLESKLLSYLINLHTGERPIYFIRNGQSEDSLKGKLGGDSNLSENGRKFTKALETYFINEVNVYNFIHPEKLIIYCSSLKRSIQTAENINFLGTCYSLKSLDELNVGIFEGMTYQEIKQKFPKEFDDRNRDKLRYRYPRGESYMDMIMRIESIIFEIERQDGPIIIVSHQGILRCLYGYFALVPIEEIPTLEIPRHAVIKFIPKTYGFEEERIYIDPETNKICSICKECYPKYKDTLTHTPDKTKMNL